MTTYLLPTGARSFVNESWNFAVYSSLSNNVYFLPYYADCILVVNAASLAVNATSMCGLNSNNEPLLRLYSRGAEALDGNIYVAPCEADHILVIHPTNHTFTKIPLPPGQSDWVNANSKFAGVVVAGDEGDLFFTPRRAPYVIFYNVFNRRMQQIQLDASQYGSSVRYSEAVLVETAQRIVAVPSTFSSVPVSLLVLDLGLRDVSTFELPPPQASEKQFCGANALPSHGVILAAPRSAAGVLVLNMTADFENWAEAANGSTSSIPIGSAAGPGQGAGQKDQWCEVLEGKDNLMYSVPRSGR